MSESVPLRRSAGFSVAEVLASVVLVAGLCAIAIPWLGSVGREDPAESAKRTAKIVAATAENAKIAGDQTLTHALNAEAAVGMLSDGVRGEGAFEEFEYKVHIPERQRMNVLRYLKYEEGNLQYDGSADFD